MKNRYNNTLVFGERKGFLYRNFQVIIPGLKLKIMIAI